MKAPTVFGFLFDTDKSHLYVVFIEIKCPLNYMTKSVDFTDRF